MLSISYILSIFDISSILRIFDKVNILRICDILSILGIFDVLSTGRLEVDWALGIPTKMSILAPKENYASGATLGLSFPKLHTLSDRPVVK